MIWELKFDKINIRLLHLKLGHFTLHELRNYIENLDKIKKKFGIFIFPIISSI